MKESMQKLKVLMVTSEWPNPDNPYAVPFLVRQKNFLEQHGVSVQIIHFRGNKKPWSYFKNWLKFRRIPGLQEFHLIHAQFGQAAFLTLPPALPLVITFRGSDLEGIVNEQGLYDWRSFAIKSISKLASRFADASIIVSPHMELLLPRSVKNLHVLPAGLDFTIFPKASKMELRRKLKISQDKILILFPANPEEKRKRYELAKKTMDHISYHKAELMVVWNESHGRVLEFMKASDVLLFTSMHEGSPNVVKEALASNLRIVTTDVGDVSYRLNDIPGCYISPDGDPVRLAKLLDLAIEDLENPRDYSPYIRDLDENELTKKLVGIYRDVIRQ